MQKRETKSKGLILRMGVRYIEKYTSTIEEKKPCPYVLTERQKKELKKISQETYFLAALTGVLAVLVVVLPVNINPDLFGVQHLELMGYAFDFELYYTLFAVLMLFPEIWFLNYINLRAVKKICMVSDYPNRQHREYEEQVLLMTEAGLEMPAKHLQAFEIDPYVGLSRFSYYSIILLNKLKATLSNVLVKLLIKRFLGRSALRIVTDLAGIPVFAFWNAWASRSVIKETLMRVMAHAATTDFLEEMKEEDLRTVEDKIGLTFHFIAQTKRSYNFAIYAYIREIVRILPDVSLKVNHEVKLEELFSEDPQKNRLVAKILVFGLIVDGSLSLREKLVLKHICEKEWFPYEIDQLEEAVDGYCKGKGLPLL